MTLAELRRRLKRRIKGRDRQTRLWKKTGRAGHGKAAKKQSAAVRFLREKIIRVTRVRWISSAGVQFIASFEGLPNGGRPYNDPVGYATVGYGHLLGYRPVRQSDYSARWIEGQKRAGQLTQAEAYHLLNVDLHKSYEPAVRKLFTRGGPLEGKFEQGLYDALVSVVYNLGVGAVQGVSGFETLGRAIQSGDKRAIADAVLLYDKASGHALPGLTRRRRAERHLILTGKYK